MILTETEISIESFEVDVGCRYVDVDELQEAIDLQPQPIAKNENKFPSFFFVFHSFFYIVCE